MWSTKPIVVGVKCGAASESALRWAAALAETTGHRVRAVTVTTLPLTMHGPDVAAYVPGLDPFDGAVLLERCLERAIADPFQRAEVERRVLTGAVAQRLAEQAGEAALLVLGQSESTFGRSGYGVARQLVNRATCPVVVVPASATTLCLAESPHHTAMRFLADLGRLASPCPVL
jgi:nucleotide-binding universal stress UspA family protein